LPGKFAASGMNKGQMFATLSSGIVFTGIAAGFVEEMVFRGVIMSLIKERWNSGIVHPLWNIVVIGGGLTIGEKADEHSVITYILDSKSFALTGGEFGIESSVVALMGYLAVTLIAFAMIKKKAKRNI